MLELQGIVKRFGDFVAVDHINFDVRAGEVVGYLGPNGSGKTTLMTHLADCLVRGDLFLGKTTCQTPVIYLTHSIIDRYLGEREATQLMESAARQ